MQRKEETGPILDDSGAIAGLTPAIDKGFPPLVKNSIFSREHSLSLSNRVHLIPGNNGEKMVSSDSEQEKEKKLTHAAVDISESIPTQPLSSETYASLRVKIPTVGEGEVASPLLYDSEEEQYYYITEDSLYEGTNDQQQLNKSSSNSSNAYKIT